MIPHLVVADQQAVWACAVMATSGIAMVALSSNRSHAYPLNGQLAPWTQPADQRMGALLSYVSQLSLSCVCLRTVGAGLQAWC